MTHPQEAVEALARALYVESWTGWIAPAWAELGEEGRGHWIARATALLDQIAPLYREQAARIAEGIDAKAFRARYEVTYTKKRFDQYSHEKGVNNALNIQAEDVAAAIRKGE